MKTAERETSVIRAPHDGSEVGVCTLAGPKEVRAALDANVAATRACRDMPSYERAITLRRIGDEMAVQRQDLSRTLALEPGKPISQALVEVDRAISLFRDAAEEATRIGGEEVFAPLVTSRPTGDSRRRSTPSTIRPTGSKRASSRATCEPCSGCTPSSTWAG